MNQTHFVIIIFASALVAVLILRAWMERPQLRVLVHRAYFKPDETGEWNYSKLPQWFVKVTNDGRAPVEVLGVIYADEATLLAARRQGPVMLRPGETWESWIEEAALPSFHSPQHFYAVHPGGRVAGRFNYCVAKEGPVESPGSAR